MGIDAKRRDRASLGLLVRLLRHLLPPQQVATVIVPELVLWAGHLLFSYNLLTTKRTRTNMNLSSGLL